MGILNHMNNFSIFLDKKELSEGINDILSSAFNIDLQEENKRQKIVLIDEEIIDESAKDYIDSKLSEFDIANKYIPDEQKNVLTEEEEEQFDRLANHLTNDANFLQTFHSRLPMSIYGGGMDGALTLEYIKTKSKDANFDNNNTGMVSTNINDAIVESFTTNNVVRIISSDSPYTVTSINTVIFGNTDNGNITINLPIGSQGRKLRITNTGSKSYNVIVVPNGLEKLYGENDSFSMIKGETIEIYYDLTDGWW